MKDDLPDQHRRLDPRVKTLWRVGSLAWLVPLLVIAVAAMVVAAVEEAMGIAVGIFVVALVITVVTMVMPGVRYQRWSWRVDESGLDLAHGVLVRNRSSIPSFRVQQVDIAQSPLERAFGLATLRISTASAMSDGVVPGIAAQQADSVRRLILERVAADDGV